MKEKQKNKTKQREPTENSETLVLRTGWHVAQS